MINVTKLHKELAEAGIKFSGCDATSRVIDLQGKDIQDQSDVQQVITNHDPAAEPTSTDTLGDYSKSEVTKDDLLLALWKKGVHDDPADATALQTKIDLAGL